MNVVHTIPVGGEEPPHVTDLSCWCQPIELEPNIVVHHAKDFREARERHGVVDPLKPWVLVLSPPRPK